MTELVAYYVIPTALALLPGKMDSQEARAFMLAIMLQESKGLHRDQIDPKRLNGPALGLWQFEEYGAVHGVLTHAATKKHARTVLDLLRYDVTVDHRELRRATWEAIEHNDLLACCFARLNLWWLPDPLPQKTESDRAWEQYLEAWKPGRPKPRTWAANYITGWEMVSR